MKASDELFIDREFADLIPAPSAEEYQQLEQNLIADGCQDALTVWDEGKNGNLVILDGHTRYKICQANEISYRVKIMRFASRDEARDWMINRQLGRRNLSQEQRTYLLGQLYNSRKPEPTENLKNVGKSSKGQKATAAEIAEAHKVDPKTVKRAGEFATAVDTIAKTAGSEVKDAILSREVKSSDADVKKLAALPPKQQQAAAKKITSGKVESVKEAVNAVAPPKKKAGSPGFDEKKITTPLGQLIRGVDARANSQGGKGRQHAYCMSALKDFNERYTGWIKTKGIN